MDRTPNLLSFQPLQPASAASRSPPQGQPCFCALSFVFLEDSSFYFSSLEARGGGEAGLSEPGTRHVTQEEGKPATWLGAVQGSCSQFKSHLQL